MARVTVSDAARVTGVSRTLLYRYIKAGKPRNLSRPCSLTSRRIWRARVAKVATYSHCGDVHNRHRIQKWRNRLSRKQL